MNPHCEISDLGDRLVVENRNAARRNAQQVVRSLNDMGLPSDRVSLSATSAPDARTNEVRIFIR